MRIYVVDLNKIWLNVYELKNKNTCSGFLKK